MTNKELSGTGTERDSMQKIAKVKYRGILLDAFLHSARCVPIDRLDYLRMVFGCSGGGALLHVP